MTRRTGPDDLLRLAVPTAPALSPDGGRVAYVLRTADAEADRTAYALWQVDVASGATRRLTAGPADSAPAWSSDGRWTAFLRAQDGPPQVWVLPTGGGEARQLTRLPLGAGAPVWSPDGSRIAFTGWVDPEAVAGEDDAARARRQRAPVVADLLDYQPDGAGLLGRRRRHVHVVGADGSGCRQLTSGDWHAGEPVWSPDGRRLALPAQTGGDRDLVARAPVLVLDVDDPEPLPRPMALTGGFASTVTWASDRELVVVGTPGDPVGHAHLLRVPLDGGAPVDLAPDLDRNVMPGGPGYPGAVPALTDGGETVVFAVRDAGCTHLYAVGLHGGPPRPLLDGAGRVVSGASVVGGRAAVALATPDAYGEVVLVDLRTRATQVLTEHGAALSDVVAFRREERTFAVSDGTTVQGWLLRDPDRDPDRDGPLPLLLDVHGGPHNAWNGAADDVHLYHQELAARGWAVLVVNPRGSDGYGETFYRGVDGAWGVADAQDLLEPVDALVAEGLADPDRLALTGYSYGGFMTCYLTGLTDRFRAAVAGGVVSDLVSAAGTSDDGAWMAAYELGGVQPWQDRERYARMSPYERVDRVRTPTLVLHGAADTRCPVGQAQQWHAALRAQGVPTRLVLYPGGSHLFVLDGPPSHRVDYGARLVAWVEQHAAGPVPDDVPALAATAGG